MGVQDEKLRTGNRKTVFSVSTNDNSPVTFFSSFSAGKECLFSFLIVHCQAAVTVQSHLLP